MALVLERAAELEDRRTHRDVSQGGMTLDQLQEIAREVGIHPDRVIDAVRSLEDTRRWSDGAAFLGPPAVRKRARAVPGRLTDDAVAALVQTAENVVAASGTVSEALGAVRWTATNRHRTVQVAVARTDDETQIQVTDRYAARVPRLMHFVPAMSMGMLGLVVAGSAGLAVAPLVAGGALLGGAIGRRLWQWTARRSEHMVTELVDRLAASAPPPEPRNGSAPRSPIG